MKKKTILIAAAAAALSLGIGAKASANTDMYRMYNQNSGEHFYTATPSERDNLVKVGWNYEGIGWVAPDSGAPVYRLYNPNAGDHFYTLSSFEKDSLVKAGWNSEGIGWYSGGNIPLYRAYNPNAVAGAHNYTTGTYEQSQLIADGWRDEKIGWYGVGMGQAAMNLEQINVGNYSSIAGVWENSAGKKLVISSQSIKSDSTVLSLGAFERRARSLMAPINGTSDPLKYLYFVTAGTYGDKGGNSDRIEITYYRTTDSALMVQDDFYKVN